MFVVHMHWGFLLIRLDSISWSEIHVGSIYCYLSCLNKCRLFDSLTFAEKTLRVCSLYGTSLEISKEKKNFSWSGTVFFNTILKTLDSNLYHRWFDCLHCLFRSHVVSIFSEANTWIKLLMAYLCIDSSKWNFPALFHLILLFAPSPSPHFVRSMVYFSNTLFVHFAQFHHLKNLSLPRVKCARLF